MLKKYLNSLTVVLMAASAVLSQGTFLPRDSDEEHAWRLYNQYKESRRIEAPLEAQIKAKFNDALMAAYGALAGKAVDPGDVAEARALQEKMEAERARQAALLAAWEKKFYWRYGDLRWFSDKIHDAKTNRDMDRIEFALTYFPFNKNSAKPDTSTGPVAGIYTAEKGSAKEWSHIRVTLENVTEFKTVDRPGWRNNGTGFLAAAAGTGPVSIKIDLTGKGGISYFDYASSVSAKTSDGKILVADRPTISKDGGNRSYSAVWDPAANPGGVTILVNITGGNPEFFTYYVSGTVGAGKAPPVAVFPTPSPTPRPTPLAGSETAGTTIVEPSSSSFYPLDLSVVGGKKGRPHTAKAIEVDDGSYVRLKSTDERRLTFTIPLASTFQSTGVAIVSNLDDATYVVQGATIARMTVIKSNGEERFDIQAGVHSSEWNYGQVDPKHKRAEDAAIGSDRYLVTFRLARPGVITALRFDYVETNAAKWAGHGPGFALRGVTLLGAGVAVSETKTPDISPTKPPGWRTTAVEKEIFSNSNIYGVENGGRSPLLEFTEAVAVTYIMTYHWNSGRGAPTGTIALRRDDGTIFGPWSASGTAGQGGVPSANWEVRPNIVIPAGRYQVIDSDPSTWAQNAQTRGKGFVVIKGTGVVVEILR